MRAPVHRRGIPVVVAALLAACGTAPVAPGPGHLRAESAPETNKSSIPAPVQNTVSLPKPRPAPKVETYSVVVNNVRVQELLFALARDAKLNVDIHPGIAGVVTLNAIDQTLQQLLSRIAKQVDMRWELDGPNLAVMPDTPFLRTYRVDYVNMSRDASITSSINPQVSSGSAGAGAASTGNTAVTKIEDVSRNRFWETLDRNIKDILRETDKILPEGSSETVIQDQSLASQSQRAADHATGGSATTMTPVATHVSGGNTAGTSATEASARRDNTRVIKTATFKEAASVIVNPESGVVSIRATSRQHEKIQEFLDQVISSARRQVLIEATIAEVTLSQNYQQGIDWQRMRADRTGFSLTQAAPGVLTSASGATTSATAAGGANLNTITQTPSGSLTSAASNSLFVLGYRNPASATVGFATAVKLLESFGNVKVLSSPKLSVLNNQTAVLNVGNQVVYFKVTANTTTSSTGLAQTTVDTTPQTASVGLLMSVTPQISDDGTVLLNVRPSISRITGFKNDPNPSIPAGLTNQVPEIQRREMESMLRIADGEIAVLGGLMQDSIDYKDDGVPGLSRLPIVGNLFNYKNETNTKTELVIFLRPTIIRDSSINGDYRAFRDSLPDKDYLKRTWAPKSLGGEAR